MKFWIVLFLLPFFAHGATKTYAPQSEAFIILIQDRSISVISPEKKRQIFAVIVENRSLSDQVARFKVEGKILKFVSVKSGRSETVEIDNKTSSNPIFEPVSPAFQDVELIFGKKAYEIPPKE